MPRIIVPAIALSIVILCSLAGLVAFISIIDSNYISNNMLTVVLVILKDTLNLTLSFALSVSALIIILHFGCSKVTKLERHNEFCVIFVSCVVMTLFLMTSRYYVMGEQVFPAFLMEKHPAKNYPLLAALIFVSAGALLFRRRLSRLVTSLVRFRGTTLVSAAMIIVLTIGLNLLILHLSYDRKQNYPSILLISLDTLRKDHLGCYGYEHDSSPTIDAFAREAVLFRNAFSHAPWTLPSHMSLFTSQYSLEHGLIRENQQLSSDHRGFLLAELLKNNLYTNVAFTDGAFMTRAWGFGDGFDMYFDKGGNFKNPLDSRVFSFLENNKKFPFFLFLHTYCIHNYYSPEKYLNMFDPGCDGKFHEWDEIKPFILEYGKSQLDSAAVQNELNHLIRLYDASIRYVDDRIGLLFQRLKDLKIYDDLLIIITSDHGEEFGDHNHTYHGHTLFDELISVPLIVKFPGYRYKGTIVDEHVSHVDLVPTILDYLGLQSRSWMRGESLLGLIRTEETTDQMCYSELLSKRTMKFSLRTPQYNLIYESPLTYIGDEERGSFMLFDSINDPGEQFDISDVETESLVLLKGELRRWLQPLIHEHLGSIRKTKMSAGLEERLKALGYLQ